MNIYEKHGRAFNLVSAYVITDKAGARVGTVAFKFPKDGAGRLWCYMHNIGLPMVRAQAGGYGYDKRSAAAYNAAKLIAGDSWASAVKNNGQDWIRDIEDAGFNVRQAG